MTFKYQHQGSILIEMLVACVLIAIFLPLLVVASTRLQERHRLAQAYQDQFEIKAAIEAHFQAQWARLVPANCYPDDTALLTIGSGMSPPVRLASRKVAESSDWIKGTDYGLCRRSLTVHENPLEVSMACHWRVGDPVVFSSCNAGFSGQLTYVNSRGNRSRIAFDDEDVIGQSGVIESQNGFYWYLSPGKDGREAFWRTPAESGNSLELFNGIERVAIFALLDENNDGLVDALGASYGDVSLKKLRGLWVEYQYHLRDCGVQKMTLSMREYVSMRGETWSYFAPCQGVGNQIIIF
ncbi:type II secretion system protein [Marinomonas sp. IMCC 4694]|uniref:type II secretion system protein n=1 Tax=Marinomonas sp. IMCC 4694 TaxID=2605432 RepID=UPI0011E6FF7D|nr:type II secretion system protein [Marinomonas sp. IMCC 4694]TYL47577.1 type II secretion system protein [Marinomonas sp. IMCC 4694]